MHVYSLQIIIQIQAQFAILMVTVLFLLITQMVIVATAILNGEVHIVWLQSVHRNNDQQLMHALDMEHVIVKILAAVIV